MKHKLSHYLTILPLIWSISSASVSLEVLNEADAPVIIHWINPDTEPPSLVQLSDAIPVFQRGYINTYSGHQFVVKYADTMKKGSVQFMKSSVDEVVVIRMDSEIGMTVSNVGSNIAFSTNRVKHIESDVSTKQGDNGTRRSNLKKKLLDSSEPIKTSFKVKNDADRAVQVFWVNGDTGALTAMGEPINPKAAYTIDSYEGHKFKIQYAEHVEGGEEVEFIKGPFEETVEVFMDEIGMDVDVSSKYSQFEGQVEDALELCADEIDDLYVECIARNTFSDLENVMKAHTELTYYRDSITERLRNYTCKDDTLNTTAPLRTELEVVHDKTVKVDTHLDMEHAKIWVVHEFVSPDECGLLMEHAAPKLERAAVVGEDGLGEVSESRRAQQAGYDVSGPDDPLWNLYQRVLNFTNSHTNFDLRFEGQEYFVVIQYNVSDEYIPHCDGECDGSEHVETGRVATAVLYCQIPERGGGTTFTKADVFVKPEVGMASIFTYMGSDGLMDTGFTEHSGCPVLEGEKWITTAWLRHGVSLDKPANMYDPSGNFVAAKEALFEEETDFLEYEESAMNF
mmetsp:Transcript_20006/g.28734  ORF Transcript_20006/g.28734 Transcript_20006/m.28734 type:complete len:567 (+) Transcript_20006:78-1778(+)